MDIVFKIGILIFVVGVIFFTVEMFKTSVGWGIACIFISPLAIVFSIMHWRVVKTPILIKLAGIALMIVGSS